LSQLSQLFQSLNALTEGGGALWLLGVGLTWATTCFLDCPVPSSSFEAAGLQLLKAGLVASADLAEHGLVMVLQRLIPGDQRLLANTSNAHCSPAELCDFVVGGLPGVGAKHLRPRQASAKQA